MPVAYRSRRIAASVKDAWAVLSDFDRLADWAPNIDHTTALTDPATGVNAARRVQVGRIALVERVVVWEASRRLAYRIEGLPARFGTVENAWTIEPDGSEIVVRLTTTVDAGARPLQRIVGKGVAMALARVSDQLLDAFENRLKREPRT